MIEPWFWGPMILAGALALVFGAGAYHYRQGSYPAKVNASGFTGIVRETAKFELLGSGAGLVASILADELSKFHHLRFAFASILLISLLAAMLNYYMGAALDTRKTDDEKAIELTSPVWEVLHGAIFGLSLGAGLAVIATVISFVVEL